MAVRKRKKRAAVKSSTSCGRSYGKKRKTKRKAKKSWLDRFLSD